MAERLRAIACHSVADARTIISTEGFLRRVEDNLAATNTVNQMKLASCSLLIVGGAANSADNAVCVRIAEEATLRQTLLRFTVRGLGRGDGSPAAMLSSAAAETRAAVVFQKLTVRSALVGVCARDVDALSDADLQALVDRGVSPEKHDHYAESVILTLQNCCRCRTSLLHRLIGMSLPLALAKLLASDAGFHENTRARAAMCIQIMMEAARMHGPPLESWARPIIKPLRAAYVHSASVAARGMSPVAVGLALRALSTNRALVRSRAGIVCADV